MRPAKSPRATKLIVLKLKKLEAALCKQRDDLLTFKVRALSLLPSLMRGFEQRLTQVESQVDEHAQVFRCPVMYADLLPNAELRRLPPDNDSSKNTP